MIMETIEPEEMIKAMIETDEMVKETIESEKTIRETFEPEEMTKKTTEEIITEPDKMSGPEMIQASEPEMYEPEETSEPEMYEPEETSEPEYEATPVKNRLGTSEKHLALRKEADARYRLNAEKMRTKYCKAKRKKVMTFKCGDIVSVKIPRIDRTSTDFH